ncbi:MAG: c-type cytochrome [Polymorphobacter sp.]|uniref:c-type cytochrome n=1 Tax=Polymorphobacter sp. TaxID=1909290 RepID=UPI003A8904E4
MVPAAATVRLLAGIAAACLPLAAAAQPAGGPALYARCAACHTADGRGVPGAFPPLKANVRWLAAEPEGRRYLQLAIIKGLNGAITVDGRSYRGLMPPQALDDDAVAAVLNHIGTEIAAGDPPVQPFTAAEVSAARAGAKDLNGAAVARLRPAKGP